MLEDQRVASTEPREENVRGHHPFVLNEADVLWIVASGSAVVFATRIEDGIPVGKRRILGHLGRGEPVLAIGGSDSVTHLGVLAIDDLTLVRHSLKGVRPDYLIEGVPLLKHLEAWVDRLSSFLGADQVRADVERISEAGTLVLKPRQAVRPERGEVCWVKPETGGAVLLGAPHLRLPRGTYLPIGEGTWIESSDEEVRLEVAAPEASADPRQVLDGIRAFHGLVVAEFERLNSLDRETEIRRLEERSIQQAQLRESALEDMAAILNPRPRLPRYETPLLTAVAAVGESMGIKVYPPARSEDLKRVKDPVDGIARASRIRHRRVLLRGRWWENDSGPLLGYLTDGHHPVALVRTQGARYEIIDPRTKERTLVDEESALLLDPEAVMFYRRLPEGKLRPWHLVAFSMRGLGTDITFLLGLSVVATLIGMLTPVATALVLDTAIPDSNERLLLELGLGLVAASVGIGLLALAQGVVAVRMSVSTDAATQSALWDRLLSLRPSFYKGFSSGDLLTRTSAVGEITRELNGTTLKTMLASLMTVLNFGLLLYYSSRLAWIAVGMAAVTGSVTVVGGYFIRRYNLTLLELKGAFFGLVTQMIRSVNKIRVRSPSGSENTPNRSV